MKNLKQNETVLHEKVFMN